MSARFHRNSTKLKDLHKASAKKKRQILKTASTDLICCLCECALNIRQGNVPLSSKQFGKLKKYHKQLKALSRKSSSVKTKQKVLQSGGFIGALLAPLAKLLLGGLLGK